MGASFSNPPKSSEKTATASVVPSGFGKDQVLESIKEIVAATSLTAWKHVGQDFALGKSVTISHRPNGHYEEVPYQVQTSEGGYGVGSDSVDYGPQYETRYEKKFREPTKLPSEIESAYWIKLKDGNYLVLAKLQAVRPNLSSKRKEIIHGGAEFFSIATTAERGTHTLSYRAEPVGKPKFLVQIFSNPPFESRYEKINFREREIDFRANGKPIFSIEGVGAEATEGELYRRLVLQLEQARLKQHQAERTKVSKETRDRRSALADIVEALPEKLLKVEQGRWSPTKEISDKRKNFIYQTENAVFCLQMRAKNLLFGKLVDPEFKLLVAPKGALLAGKEEFSCGSVTFVANEKTIKLLRDLVSGLDEQLEALASKIFARLG